ncbi:MAG: gliding motility-associated protein GldE [Flavobacteriales bacterium]
MEVISCVLLDVYLLSVVSSAGPLVLVLLLLLCSALISGSEVALFSITPAQRAELKESKDRSSQTIIELLEKPDKETGPKKLLATILIANNAVNIAIVLLATQLASEWFPSQNYPGWVKTLIDVVAITFILVLFGEVIPKVYATGNNLRNAKFMAIPLKYIQQFFSPLTFILMKTSNVLEGRLNSRATPNITVDDLGHALELTQDDNLSKEENKILEGIVTFGEKEVGEIMTPRTDIASLWEEDSFADVMETVMEKGYSRLPVFKNSPDEIAGFLFIKDLLPHIDEVEFEWQTLIRQPFFVPENKKIDDLLQQFQQDKVHLAIVVDEYGGTSGLITLEDILEEIVGNISDEFDDEELHYSKLDDRQYVFEGKTSLVDVYKVLQIDDTLFDEAKGDSTTLAGFVIEQAARLLEKGDVIEFEGFTFTIEAADKRKIKRIKITLPESVKNE